MTPRATVALAVGCTALTVWLTVQVVTGHGLVAGVDHHVHDWVDGHRIHMVHRVADVLTTVIAPPVDAAALLAVVAWRRRERLPAAVAVVLVLAAVVLSMKYAVGRPSPSGQRLARGVFPSGHTASALICSGAAVQLLVPAGGRRRGTAAVGVLTVLIAASLVEIDAHWLSDCVAATAIGVVVLTGLRAWLDRPGPAPAEPVRPRATDR